jgi:hypothetical protein
MPNGFMQQMPIAKVGLTLPASPNCYGKPYLAFKATSLRRRTALRLSKPILGRSRPAVFTFLGRLFARMRYPYFMESRIDPPDGITPQDRLS